MSLTLYRVHMGRDADPDLDTRQWGLEGWGPNLVHEPGWETPYEDVADGCPAGWHRSVFAESVARYLRTRGEGGVRSSSPVLDLTSDRTIREAVQYYERYEDKLLGWRHRLDAERRRAEG